MSSLVASFRERRADIITVAIVFGIVFVSIWFEFREPINRDVSTFIYYAQECLFRDKVLYRDLIDINPPFSTWFFMPSVTFAHHRGMTPTQMIGLCRSEIYLFIAIAFFLTCAVLKNYFSLSKVHRQVFVILYCFAIFIGCAQTFGQREHLIVAFLLPELLLASSIAYSKKVVNARSGSWIRIACGVMAWAAIAMKPHYILPLLFQEIFIFARTRQVLNHLRPEILAIVAFGIFYVVIIFLAYPSMFEISGPLAVRAYRATSFLSLKVEIYTAVTMASLLLIRFILPVVSKENYFDGFLIGIFGCYAAYLLQGMGLTYQKIPTEILASIWLVLVLPPVWPLYKTDAGLTAGVSAWLNRRKIRFEIFSVVLLIAAFLLFELSIPFEMDLASKLVASAFNYNPDFETRANNGIRDLIRRYADKQPVLVLSTGNDSFPAIVYENVELASRWSHLWALPAELDLPADRQGMVAGALAEDMERYRPKLVIVSINNLQLHLPYEFDYIKYFSQSPEFREQWRHYHPIPEDPNVDRGLYALYSRDN